MTIPPENQAAGTVATCPNGERAYGGGFIHSAGKTTSIYGESSGPLDGTELVSDTLVGDVPEAWYAAAQNTTANEVKLTVAAICE